MKNDPWRNSVLKRLIVSFILILLPIYILSIIIYNLGIRTLRQEISNSMISQISLYLDSWEKEVQSIRALQFDLVNDEDINQLASIPQSLNDIGKMKGLLRIQQRLYAIKNSSKHIHEIFVVIPAVDRQISSLTVSELDKKLYDTMKNIPLLPDTQIININGVMYLNVSYPYTYTAEDKEKLFIIVIELSREKFKETLGAMIGNSDEGVVFVDHKDRLMIATNEDNTLNGQIYGSISEKTYDTVKNAEVVTVQNRRYLAVYKVSDFLNSVLCKYVPEDSIFSTLKKYSGWFILLTASAISIIVVYSVYMYKFIHKPLSRLAASFKKVEKGDFRINIKHAHDDEFRYIYTRFNVMVENLKTLIDQVYKQKILVQKAEMKQLQSQINPHFLYNSFFILNTMTRIGDYENLECFTEQLGKYFQFVTRNAADEVPISVEVNHARTYAEIQAMRFSNWVRMEFDELPETFSGLTVPRLILQPILENAFEHGLKSDSKKGVLLVRFEKLQDEYRIIVEDNGEEMDANKLEMLQHTLFSHHRDGEITAMQNIYQRIQLKFGPQSGLSAVKGEMGGLKVTIYIKYKEEAQNVQAADCG